MYEEMNYNSYGNEDPQMPSRWFVLLTLAALLVSMLLAGCTATRYVPVEKTVTEIRYRDSIRHDSIYQRDSIYLEVGKDTVYKYKQRTEYRYLFLNKTDTLCLADTVRVTEVQRVEVEQPLKWYDQALLWYGRIAFIALLCFALSAFLQWKKK